ncbi:hypothetical protein [Polyangium mundeleinium]|uniref:Class I SAM-dependent methyltransferase n=1 Tax=Polyangium mundeleinium TaxID=2995306 RepID=A0ABT5ES70_9BACT|nr:hypothetical protein [Polyangium mundeleinium]MDC0744665.1 hypothetical protein [Polyangium mundeleinium]
MSAAPLHFLVAELCAAKSVEELERVYDAIRARGTAALRTTATEFSLRVAGFPVRLQRAAVRLGVEAGGEEGKHLLLVMIDEGNVEVELRNAAVRALDVDTSSGTLSTLLSVLSNEGPSDTELSQAILAYLARLPGDCDWRSAVRALHGSCLNPLAGVVHGEDRSRFAALFEAVDSERRTRRGPSIVYQRHSVHHVPPAPSRDGTLHNPYLDEFQRWEDRPGIDDDDRFWELRDEMFDLKAAYAYAIPTRAALELLAAHAPIVEIGAGAGYWAYLLRQMGVDVVAYDHEPPDGTYRNMYFEGGRAWTDVLEGGPEMVQKHGDRALFLCWPPFGDPMAEACLEAFVGDVVVWAGEWRRACATQAFFDALDQSFEEIAAEPLPAWLTEDALRVFRRRTR